MIDRRVSNSLEGRAVQNGLYREVVLHTIYNHCADKKKFPDKLAFYNDFIDNHEDLKQLALFSGLYLESLFEDFERSGGVDLGSRVRLCLGGGLSKNALNRLRAEYEKSDDFNSFSDGIKRHLPSVA